MECPIQKRLRPNSSIDTYHVRVHESEEEWKWTICFTTPRYEVVDSHEFLVMHMSEGSGSGSTEFSCKTKYKRSEGNDGEGSDALSCATDGETEVRETDAFLSACKKKVQDDTKNTTNTERTSMNANADPNNNVWDVAYGWGK